MKKITIEKPFMEQLGEVYDHISDLIEEEEEKEKNEEKNEKQRKEKEYLEEVRTSGEKAGTAAFSGYTAFPAEGNDNYQIVICPANNALNVTFKGKCGITYEYKKLIKTWLEDLDSEFEKRKKAIYNPDRERKKVYPESRCTVERGTGASGHFVYSCGYSTASGRKHDCVEPYEAPLSQAELEELKKKQENELIELNERLAYSKKILQIHVRAFVTEFLYLSNMADNSAQIPKIDLSPGVFLGLLKLLIENTDNAYAPEEREELVGNLVDFLLIKIKAETNLPDHNNLHGEHLDDAESDYYSNLEALQGIIEKTRELIKDVYNT